MEAHVADFGIAKNIQPARTHTSTHVLGTIGYIDPEYAQTSRLNEKSDVYSFGIVLLELLTNKMAVDDEINLLDWVNNTLSLSIYRTLCSFITFGTDMQAQECLTNILYARFAGDVETGRQNDPRCDRSTRSSNVPRSGCSRENAQVGASLLEAQPFASSINVRRITSSELAASHATGRRWPDHEVISYRKPASLHRHVQQQAHRSHFSQQQLLRRHFVVPIQGGDLQKIVVLMRPPLQ